MGQKPHQVTEDKRNFVREMRRLKMPAREIAKQLRCDYRTLKREYATELDLVSGEMAEILADANKRLGKKALSRAEEYLDRPDCPPSIVIFTLKAVCGWQETVVLEHGKRDRDDWTDEELDRIIESASSHAAKATDPRAQKADRVRELH